MTQTPKDRAARLLGLIWSGASSEELRSAFEAELTAEPAPQGPDVWARLLDRILEIIPVGLAMVSHEGVILKANDAAAEFMGIPRELLLGFRIASFEGLACWEDGSPCAVEDYPVNRCLETGEPQPTVTMGIRRPAGDLVWGAWNTGPLEDPEGVGLGAVMTVIDVTPLKRTEKALRRSEEKFRALVHSSPDHILTVDAEGTVLFLNRTHPDQEEVVVGKSCYDLLPPGQEAQVRLAIQAAVGDGTVSRFEYETPQGRAYSTQVAPLEREGDRPTVILIASDVTELRQAEEERQNLEARVRQAQRLESLGLLAGGIAHDFNNLLVGILGRIELTERGLAPDSPLLEHMIGARTASLRASELVNQLLACSGRGQLLSVPLDLNSLVRESVQLLEVTLPPKVSVDLDLHQDLPGVKADASQLRQIVLNLVTNGAEAMEVDGGAVWVRTRLTGAETVKDAAYPPEVLSAERYLVVEVTDQGCGISHESISRLFDPFYTTKFTGRGLGLAAVLGIVRAHGGALDVESEPGHGATLRVLLPALAEPVSKQSDLQAPSAPGPQARPDERPASHKERPGQAILVIDDEKHVRSVTRAVLEEFGYEVLTAEDGREGVATFQEHADRIPLVLLDLLMPNMDGEEAFRLLREVRPDVQVILSSGFGEETALAPFAVEELTGFLKKPYRLDELLTAVSKALDETG